jgi:hypothetical protein
MISTPHPIPTLADDRTRRAALAVAVAALALFGTVAAVGTAAADDPQIRVSTATVADGETATLGVALSAAPEGLAGYYLRLSVADPAVATIEGAAYPDRFGMTSDPEVEDDGRTVVLEAADLDSEIGAGATDVTLATVDVSGAAPGEVRVTAEPLQFDGDGGSAFSPTAQAGVLTVTATGDDATAGATTGTESGSAPGATTGTGAGDAAGGTDDSEATSDGSGDLPATLVVAALALFAAFAGRAARR